MKRTVLAASLMALALQAFAGEIQTQIGAPARRPRSRIRVGGAPAGNTNNGSGARSSASQGIAPTRVSFGRYQGRRLGGTTVPKDPQTQSAPAPQAGALIQTARPTKIGPESPQTFFAVDGGADFMHPDGGKAQPVNPALGVRMGRADTLPGGNSGGASGKNAITAIPNPGEGQ